MLTLLVVVVFQSGILVQGTGLYLGDLPMQNPDLFQGDILGIEDPTDLNAITDDRLKWPGGEIPYVIDSSLRTPIVLERLSSFRWDVKPLARTEYTGRDNGGHGSSFYTASTYRSQLTGAFYFYTKDTCIRFVERTNQKDYIRIFSGEGCYSHVGRTGGIQPVSLGPGCNWMGTVIHELAHALGFYHEQNRSDRDDFLIIYWDNIKEGMADQFMKLLPHQNNLLTAFDYDSIMLYGEYSFSKEPKVKKTMVAKQGNVVLKDVVAKYRMSKDDILRINKLYDCK